ncbi:hypothetical protein [Peribacillus glennii]|uniref:hypothetical protein n=1 Tax=Peribacillus glennii TaxID=2303991 RepID=UPI001314E45A|nr:hypothetical protein [Peribacillus glennii]
MRLAVVRGIGLAGFSANVRTQTKRISCGYACVTTSSEPDYAFVFAFAKGSPIGEFSNF